MRKSLFITAMIIISLLAFAGLAVPQTTQAQADEYWRGEYFQNPDLQGTPTFIREDAVITFDWGDRPPGDTGEVKGWSGDHFSARWTKRDVFISDTYVFAARSDDGIRMYVDGKLIIDEWKHRQFEWTSVQVKMTAGTHTIKVEYYEDIGRAAIQAGYYPKNPPTAVPTATKTKTGSSGGSGGSGGGGSGSGSGSSSKTSTPRPTRTPGLGGTPGGVVTQTPSLFGGTNEYVVEELDGKYFATLGFPGVVVREEGHEGSHAYVKNMRDKVTFEARWIFHPPQAGFYNVFIYVPPNPNPVTNRTTSSAIYQVHHNSQESALIALNQTAFNDEWVLIGRFFFSPGRLQYVSLINATGEPDVSREVLIDAVMFGYQP